MENWKKEKVGQWEIKETLPKAQRTWGLSALTKVTSLGHITSSNTNLDQQSEQKFSSMTKRQLPNQQTVANIILSINISNSNNLNKFWVNIFTLQGQINQVY